MQSYPVCVIQTVYNIDEYFIRVILFNNSTAPLQKIGKCSVIINITFQVVLCFLPPTTKRIYNLNFGIPPPYFKPRLCY